MVDSNTIYKWRHVARVVIEAASPLMVGSGDKSILTDAEVAVDANGLPFIPGTALAGVLRHMSGVGADSEDTLWGFVRGDKGHGSRLFFSEARLIGPDGLPVDGLSPELCGDFFAELTTGLPVRHHVRIGHRGTAENAGKYDNRVVIKGARFCFEIEAIGQSGGDGGADALAAIVGLFGRADLRLGGGTRGGYGAMRLVSAQCRSFDLGNDADFEAYAALGSRLGVDVPGGLSLAVSESSDGCEVLRLRLAPADFFLFGAAEADLTGDADMMPVTESEVEWEADGKPRIARRRILIPASSVKGALAHRTAFHYNKLTWVSAEAGDVAAHSGQRNEAVRELFGYQEADGGRMLHCGKVIMSDVILPDADASKLLNHVAIDRFTGGARAGALFTERVAATGRGFNLDVVVVNADRVSPEARKAFLLALRDMATGMLPLGGGSGRGNGFFKADEDTISLINRKLADA